MPHIAQVALLVFDKGVHNNAGIGLPARYKHTAKSDIPFLARSSRSSRSEQHRGQLKESALARVRKGALGCPMSPPQRQVPLHSRIMETGLNSRRQSLVLTAASVSNEHIDMILMRPSPNVSDHLFVSIASVR